MGLERREHYLILSPDNFSRSKMEGKGEESKHKASKCKNITALVT